MQKSNNIVIIIGFLEIGVKKLYDKKAKIGFFDKFEFGEREKLDGGNS